MIKYIAQLFYRKRLSLILQLIASIKNAYLSNIGYYIITYLFRLIVGKGLLLYVKLDVTEQCNRKCDYCYSKRRNIEPSFDDITKLFSTFNGRIGRLDLLGGEPMLRSDIYEIIKAAKEIGRVRSIALFTNGTLVNEETAVKLKSAGVDAVIVSLYSNNASMQDTISAYTGTFDMKIIGIKALVCAEIPTYTFTVITKHNVDHVESIITFVESLGAQSLFFNQIPRDKKALDIQLSAEEVYKIKALLNRLKPQHMMNVYNIYKLWGRSRIGGYMLVSVKVDGAVTYSPFVFDDAILGNAFKENIFEIFKRRFAVKDFKNIYESPQECLSCSCVHYCRGAEKAGNKIVYDDYNRKCFFCLGPWHNKAIENLADCIPYWY
ncbi:MAG: radical SAM protein [Candidatus Omnitrophica bacterium]|nr:radical SAM protein [Candidatus Omnitrophota bacterium]